MSFWIRRVTQPRKQVIKDRSLKKPLIITRQHKAVNVSEKRSGKSRQCLTIPITVSLLVPEEESIERKELGLDTDNNSEDFNINDAPSPTNSNDETVVLPEPEPLLSESPWPMFKGNSQRNGQSDYQGPSAAPEFLWVYADESDWDNPNYNPVYTSPVIGLDRTIYTSSIHPVQKRGILSLKSNGSKKNFEEGDIENPLKIVDNLAVEDEKSDWAFTEDGTAYYGEGSILYSFDSQGNKIWEREFEFINSYPDKCGSKNPVIEGPSAVGEDGTIYVVVKNNSCSSSCAVKDYLYAINPEDPENELWSVNLGGYSSSSPVVSSDGIVYIFNLYYGSSSANLYLKAVADGKIQWKERFDNTWYSLPIIDSQGNIYFLKGKKLYCFNKEGNELWRLFISDNINVPKDWHTFDNMALILSDEGILYLSGRGAVCALK